MQDSTKYLIHTDVTADGVVERSDVVGAIFGQTEGLLGDELDLRQLQEASKVGRIDVHIRSENGQSFGELTIASGLDKVETAILAAALETIDRVGPCRARFEVRKLEDVRAAKRRAVVERATELLSAFETEVLSSDELADQVRESLRVESITEYEGQPAGPRVADSDAVIVVEGRADVLQLLEYGIKNAIAVEGTNVPDAVARLTEERTATAFLDGDRGGDLILKELTQVGAVEYVAFAPEGRSVEDLSRDVVMDALREKVPFDVVADASTPHQSVAATDGSTRPAPPGAASDETEGPGTEVPPTDGSPGAVTAAPEGSAASAGESSANAPSADDAGEAGGTPQGSAGTTRNPGETAAADGTSSQAAVEDDAPAETSGADEQAVNGDATRPETLTDHVREVIGESTETVALLDEEFDVIESAPADDAIETIEATEPVPATVVLDGDVSQGILDVSAQRGVSQVVGTGTGEFVKRPATVRIRTAADFEADVGS